MLHSEQCASRPSAKAIFGTPEPRASFPIPTGPGRYERKFCALLQSTFPDMKWKVLEEYGRLDLIVYKNIDSGEKRLEIFAWECGSEPERDIAFEDVYAVMKSLNQPLNEPLHVDDHVAELRFFARQKGWNVQWILFNDETPKKHQFILIDPKGKRQKFEEHTSEIEAWINAKSAFEKACKRKLGFTLDRLVEETNRREVEAMKSMRIVYHA